MVPRAQLPCPLELGQRLEALRLERADAGVDGGKLELDLGIDHGGDRQPGLDRVALVDGEPLDGAADARPRPRHIHALDSGEDDLAVGDRPLGDGERLGLRRSGGEHREHEREARQEAARASTRRAERLGGDAVAAGERDVLHRAPPLTLGRAARQCRGPGAAGLGEGGAGA